MVTAQEPQPLLMRIRKLGKDEYIPYALFWQCADRESKANA